MIRTAALASAALLFAAAPAMAQASKVEISGNVGWVISDGVTGNSVHAPGTGQIYNELDPKDSVGYHFTFGVHASPAIEVGFLYGRQQSTLQAKGSSTRIRTSIPGDCAPCSSRWIDGCARALSLQRVVIHDSPMGR